jgi:hypothetical protein
MEIINEKSMYVYTHARRERDTHTDRDTQTHQISISDHNSVTRCVMKTG